MTKDEIIDNIVEEIRQWYNGALFEKEFRKMLEDLYTRGRLDAQQLSGDHDY